MTPRQTQLLLAFGGYSAVEAIMYELFWWISSRLEWAPTQTTSDVLDSLDRALLFDSVSPYLVLFFSYMAGAYLLKKRVFVPTLAFFVFSMAYQLVTTLEFDPGVSVMSNEVSVVSSILPMLRDGLPFYAKYFVTVVIAVFIGQWLANRSTPEVQLES